MRLNTKNEGWTYSKGRLWSQIRGGSLSQVANGSSPKADANSLFIPAEGSLFNPVEDSLISSLDGSSGCSPNEFSVSPLKKKLNVFLKFTLLAWLVVASQFSLHAHGEQKDDLAIHLLTRGFPLVGFVRA